MHSGPGRGPGTGGGLAVASPKTTTGWQELLAKVRTFARFSDDQKYRYFLSRDLGFGGDRAVMFVMLNPSTADEYRDDPTIRRCIGFAKAWGYRTLYVTNLSPLRATDPKELLATGQEPDDVRQENLVNILETALYCQVVVAAWGVHGAAEGRAGHVIQALEPLTEVHCLGLTAAGHPKHPLYVPANTGLSPYRHGDKTNSGRDATAAAKRSGTEGRA